MMARGEQNTPSSGQQKEDQCLQRGVMRSAPEVETYSWILVAVNT